MVWNENKDIMMMREIAGKGVLLHKSKSKERCQGWQDVADALNTHESFFVTSRAVRDRFTNLMKKNKVQINKELKTTGEGGKALTEFDVLIEELTNVYEDTEARAVTENEIQKQKTVADKQKAQDIRLTAMEKMGETRKRKSDENSPPEKRSRRTSSDTLTYLREKMEMDKENKQVELEERRAALAMMNNFMHQQTEQMRLMIQQQRK